MRTNERTPEKVVEQINKICKTAMSYAAPPENLTLSEWSDKKRILSPESSAEPGPWRTKRTPYLERPMNCVTDQRIKVVTLVAASQVGKTELELNAIGYIMDQAPGSILYIHPNLKVAQKFSKQRVNPMIRDCPTLKKLASKTKRSGDTILQKTFPGGILTIVGSESAADLASTPTKYILGDERDRWAKSAGREGDPWELGKARQITFPDAKAIEVSTPTVKGDSNIEFGFLQGTQEYWCTKCPHCGSYINIKWDNIRFNSSHIVINHKKVYSVTDIMFACPECGCMSTEQEMKQQPAKWIANNPDAYEKGHVSFWLNAFVSPWQSWENIIVAFLEAKDFPDRLQVVFNTQLGELWEDRGDLQTEDEMLARREEYTAELPDGVLALTCGVDTQDDRLEYEVLGHGFFGETWGIYKGYILGRPDTEEVWQQLDEVIDRHYHFENGRSLKIGLTFVDSGGHFTQEVYEQCRIRQAKRVFAIKGRGGQDIPYISTKPSKVIVNGNSNRKAWLYIIGVDAGKTTIMSNIKKETPGASYCHFPSNEGRGYDEYFFNCLLSEKLTLNKTKTGNRWIWEKIPGHNRNEALDCRNYAIAAFRVWNPDLDAINLKLKNPVAVKPQITQKSKRNKSSRTMSSEW